MSPEQVRGEVQAIGPATDVYSLGVMLFEMLTGNTPYTGSMGVVIGLILAAPVPPVKEFRADVDSRLDAICRKAMAKEPADRFASMAEFADALGKYLKALSASPPPLPAPPVAAVVKAPPPVVDRSPFDGMKDATAPIPAVKKAKRGRVVAAANRPPKWLIGAGVTVCLLLAALGILWAGGVFKVKTADGILVVQVNEPNAEVFVDGDRMTVSWNDGGTKAEIHVKPGTRKVEVRKDGFGVDGAELTFKEGDRDVFRARLLPDQLPPENPSPPVTPPEKPLAPDTPPDKPSPPVTPPDKPSPPPPVPLAATRPLLLDCTGEKGVSAADVRKAQEAWAKYLGRQVEEEDEIAPGVKMKFVLIPPGKFLMGTPKSGIDDVLGNSRM